jgi:hypothetical protein
MPTCENTGVDPGEVPAMPNFAGELLCVQVDASGLPLGGNSLTGQVSLRRLEGAEFSQYAAIGFPGNDAAGSTGDLLQLGPQYQSCAEKLVLQHHAGGAPDAVAGPGSRIDTDLFLVTCAQDLDTEVLPFVLIEFEATDEVERKFTSNAGFSGAAQFDLDAIFPRVVTGSDTLRTQVTTRSSVPEAATVGIMGVAEVTHRLAGEAAGEAKVGTHLTVEGSRYASLLIDTIVLPFGGVP